MTSPDNSVDVSVEEEEIDHPSSEPGATRTDNAVFMQGNDSVAEVAMASTTSTPSSFVSPLLSEQLAAIEPLDGSSPTSDPSNGSRPQQQQHVTVQPPFAKKGADIMEPPDIGSMSCSDLVAHLRRHKVSEETLTIVNEHDMCGEEYHFNMYIPETAEIFISEDLKVSNRLVARKLVFEVVQYRRYMGLNPNEIYTPLLRSPPLSPTPQQKPPPEIPPDTGTEDSSSVHMNALARRQLPWPKLPATSGDNFPSMQQWEEYKRQITAYLSVAVPALAALVDQPLTTRVA